MVPTAVTLTGIVGVANWIDESVTNMLPRVVTPMAASVTEKILSFVSVGLSIALVWYGCLMMSGPIHSPSWPPLGGW